MPLLPIVHAAATWIMVGVILTVHLVLYPLFREVCAGGWKAYHAAHMRRITWIVGPVMVAELATAVLLTWQKPTSVLALAGLGLLGGIWALTFFLHVPQHGRIAEAQDLDVIDWLVRTNLVRTVLWLVRGVLAAVWLMSVPG